MIDVTCAIIVNNENLILAAQRSTLMSLPLKWEFPGGKIEHNETAQMCLIREIKEELDIDIETVKSLPFNIHNYPKVTVKLIPFVCKQLSGTINLKEHATYKWVHKNDLLDLDWADADVPIIKHYLKSLNAVI